MKEIISEIENKINSESQLAKNKENEFRSIKSENVSKEFIDQEFYADILKSNGGYTNVPNGISTIDFLYSSSSTERLRDIALTTFATI